MKKLSTPSDKSPNFIGSWNIENDKLCNEIIKFFEENKSLQQKGITGLGYDPKIKKTTDITISPLRLKEPKYSLFNPYFNLLNECFLDYRKQYPFLKHKFFDKANAFFYQNILFLSMLFLLLSLQFFFLFCWISICFELYSA